LANNTFQLRRTSTAGRTPNTTAGSYAANSQYIYTGELALNLTDQILYSSDGTNLLTIGSNSTSYRAASGSANSFVANSTGVYLSQASGAVPLFANGSAGTNGWVLTTNSAGSPYWAAATGGGGGLTGSQIAANNWTFTAPITFNSNVISVNTFYTNAFSAGVGTITAAGTTTTFNNLTQYYQHVVGSTTQTINLPDETTILPGATYLIDNDSSANIIINDSAGGFLANAIPGMGVYAWSYTNSTATGNWGTYTLVPSNLAANGSAIIGAPGNTTITANGFISTFDTLGNLSVPNTVYVTNSFNTPVSSANTYALSTVVQAALYALAF